ncbi:MAG: hypothetical protein RLZZ502_865, partial [Pseudomonadota bacterium]
MKTLQLTQLHTSQQTLALRLGNSHGMQVQALATNMMRVTLKPNAGFKEPYTWAIAPDVDVPWQGRRREDISGFTLPTTEIKQNTLGTTALSCEIDMDSEQLVWRMHGEEVARDRPQGAYWYSERLGAIRHFLARDPAELYYGLGDKTGPLNLHGRRLRTLAQDSLGFDPQHGDPLYKHWPFVLCRTKNKKWYGLYYDTLSACTFDLGAEHDNYYGLFRSVEIDDGDLDYYFMVGDTAQEVVSQFVRLIGGTHLPPHYTLGFAQTAMGLTDAPKAQELLHAFIQRCETEQVPIHAFHFGSGYSSIGKGRYVFTWNRTKFPEPRKLTADFARANLPLVANLKPCLLDNHPAFQEIESRGGFIHDKNTGKPVIEPFWDGNGAHLDFTNPDTIKWWQGNLRQQILDYGIATGWNDNNEYAILDDDAQCHGFGQALPMHRARPLHSLMMTRASFEEQAKTQQQVFSVSRAGPPGIQRYAQTWSGDNSTSWDSLKWNIRTGLQMSLSGMFNVGHDVGGFSGPVPSPELFVRWVQACALNPRMVMNSWKEDGTINLPWMHESVKAEVLAALRLRERFLSY